MGNLAHMDLIQQGPLCGADFDQLMDNNFIHMFDVFSEGVFYLAPDGEVFFYNPSFYEQFGIMSGTIHFSEWQALIHPQDQPAFARKVDHHLLNDNQKITSQYRVRKLNGQYIWIEGTAITKKRDGEVIMIGSHRDVSHQKLMESYIQQAAFRDSTSGLPNRSQLLLDIEKAQIDVANNYSLIYLQVEGIKSYVNQYGSDILQQLLDNLISALHELSDRFTDYYHISPDDFAILVKGKYGSEELTRLCERIMKQYKRSLSQQNNLYNKDICLGVVPNFSSQLPPDEIVKIASRTCHFSQVKKENRLSIYEGGTKKQVERHFYIEQGLEQAILNDTLSVKFQPIVCAKTQEVASFETLVRWRTKNHGEIYPDEFIPVAEQKGFIVELGNLVFEKACRFIQKYRHFHNHHKIRVNVNVSVLQLLNVEFPDTVYQVAQQYGVPTHHIVLELTETFILDGNHNAKKQLERLSNYGFKLSLDDFGAGYSSLNSFFDLPLDQIKIDKSMAWRSLENHASGEYLQFVIQLCRANNVDIVIEGVENAFMQHKFAEMGASYLQAIG